jgi:hypothetical protein
MIFTNKIAIIFSKKTGKRAFQPIKYPNIRAKSVGGVKANVEVMQQMKVIKVQACQSNDAIVVSCVITETVSTELKSNGTTVKKIEEISGKEYLLRYFKD